MMVLSRKDNENVTIQTPNNEIIKIMITGTRYGRVLLGIECPEDYLILSEEVNKDSKIG